MIEGCSFPRVLVVGWCGSVRVAGVCLSLVVSSDCLLGANGAGPAFAGDGFGEAVAEPAEPVGVDLRPVESRGSQDLASEDDQRPCPESACFLVLACGFKVAVRLGLFDPLLQFGDAPVAFGYGSHAEYS